MRRNLNSSWHQKQVRQIIISNNNVVFDTWCRIVCNVAGSWCFEPCHIVCCTQCCTMCPHLYLLAFLSQPFIIYSILFSAAMESVASQLVSGGNNAFQVEETKVNKTQHCLKFFSSHQPYFCRGRKTWITEMFIMASSTTSNTEYFSTNLCVLMKIIIRNTIHSSYSSI